MKHILLLTIAISGCGGSSFEEELFGGAAGAGGQEQAQAGAAGAAGAAGEPAAGGDGGAAGAAGEPAAGGDGGAAGAAPETDGGADADGEADAACEPQTAVRHCGECQPGYYLSRLYDDMAGCLYLLRDCSVPCGTFFWCEWGRSTPCPTGWKNAGRLSTPECGTGSDPIDGNNTTICEPLE